MMTTMMMTEEAVVAISNQRMLSTSLSLLRLRWYLLWVW
jgi:hypothetical protein